jgi:hypothetical protein
MTKAYIVFIRSIQVDSQGILGNIRSFRGLRLPAKRGAYVDPHDISHKVARTYAGRHISASFPLKSAGAIH